MITKAFISVLDKLGIGKNSYICGYHTIQDNLEQLLGFNFKVEEIEKESTNVCKVFKIGGDELNYKPFYLIYYIRGNSVSRVEFAESI